MSHYGYKIPIVHNLFDSEDWYSTPIAVGSDGILKEDVNGIEYYKFKPSPIYNTQYMKGQFKENTQYTLTFKGMQAEQTEQGTTGFRFVYTDGTMSFRYVDKTFDEQYYTLTSSTGKTVDYVGVGYQYNYFVYARDIQLTEGTAITPTAKTYIDSPLMVNDFTDYKNQCINRSGVVTACDVPVITVNAGKTVLNAALATSASPQKIYVKFKK